MSTTATKIKGLIRESGLTQAEQIPYKWQFQSEGIAEDSHYYRNDTG